MKKIILILICLFPVLVKADYSVTNYRIDMTVLENGDLNVIEAFSMDGTYNGFERIIDYKNIYDSYSKNSLSSIENNNLYDAESIILNEIRSIDFSFELEMDELIDNSYLFEKVETAKKGEYGVYTTLEIENGVFYKIYNPSMINKDFYINYTVKNLVINHEDIAELALNLFPLNNQDITNLEIVIHIPNNEEVLKIWTHGIDSKTEILDNETVKITINNLKESDTLDFRLIFDNDIVENNKESKEFALEKIVEVESNFNQDIKDTEYETIKENAYNAVVKAENSYSNEDYANALLLVENLNEDDFKTDLLVRLLKLESKIERRNTITKVIFTSIMGILTIGLLITIYQIYKKYDKKFDRYNKKYYEDIPSNYKPYLVSFLLRKKIKKQDLFASILNLINNNKLALEKTKKDYKLIKLSSEDLSFSEERLMRFLFNREEETTFEKMKKRAKKHYKRFISKYSGWFDAATYEGNLKELYEDVLYFRIFGLCYCLISIVICLLIIDKPTYFSPFIVITLFIIAIPYFILFQKRTKKGNEEYYKWKAFERYLNNESITKDVDKYLVYAISFGCEDKIIKNNNYDMNDFIALKNVINESLDIAYKTKKEE